MSASAEIGQPKPERFWWGILLIALLLFLLPPYFANYQRILASSTNPTILAWYAVELQSGQGMVFNPGQPVLLIASPGYILLLASIRSFLPNKYLSAELLFLAVQVIGAYSLFRIARRAGLSFSAASISALLYGLASPLWSSLGSALPVMSALCLLALDLALSGYWLVAGFAAAIAVLCSPKALLPVILIFILAINQKAGRRYGLTLFIPLAVAVLALYRYYGDSLWNGLLTLKGTSLFSNFDLLTIAFYLPLAGLAIVGWIKQRREPIVALAGAWAILHIFIFGVLLRQSGLWQYASISAPLILLAMIGLRILSLRPPFLSYVVVIVLTVFPNLLKLSSSSNPFEPPIPRNMSQMGTIGIQTTQDALFCRTFPDQVMISFDGQLQPDLKEMIERSDIQSTLIRYAPDILITSSSGRFQPKLLSSGAWARLNYRLDKQPSGFHLDGQTTYRRMTPIGQFTDQPVSATYGPDIRLTGMALDQATLSPGQLLRVRLDWDYARSASTPVTVELRLESGEYVLAYAQDTYEPSIFRAGQWSTYHTLTVDPQAWTGPVTLTVGVIINNGTAGRVPVTTLPITGR